MLTVGESAKVKTAFKPHPVTYRFHTPLLTTSLKAVNTRQSDFLPLLK